MARREVRFSHCDRCLGSVRATDTHRLTYHDTEYELDLCAKHTDALDREIFGWTRLGREVEQARTFAPRAPIPAPADLYGPPIDADDADDADDAELTPVAQALVAPIPDLEWTISPHAQERIEERCAVFGYTERDVMLAAIRPENVYSDRDFPGRERRKRNGLFVVVNPVTKTVITVIPDGYDSAKLRQEA